MCFDDREVISECQLSSHIEVFATAKGAKVSPRYAKKTKLFAALCETFAPFAISL
jgi:hypothetical protein